jgi:hypothetical protein
MWDIMIVMLAAAAVVGGAPGGTWTAKRKKSVNWR